MFLKLETHANWDLFRDFLFSVSAMTIKIAKIWRMLGKAKAAAEALAAEEVIAVSGRRQSRSRNGTDPSRDT